LDFNKNYYDYFFVQNFGEIRNKNFQRKRNEIDNEETGHEVEDENFNDYLKKMKFDFDDDEIKAIQILKPKSKPFGVLDFINIENDKNPEMDE
jgi:hypothetical protein